MVWIRAAEISDCQSFVIRGIQGARHKWIETGCIFYYCRAEAGGRQPA